MAVWQYRLTVVPAAGILRQYGHLPDQLFIDHEGRQQRWGQPLLSGSISKVQFNDAYTTNWWAGLGVVAAPLVAQIDQLLPRANWSTPAAGSFFWKGDDSQAQDHDCAVSVDVSTGTLEEVGFRTDFRDPGSAVGFLSAMLALCEQHHLLVFDVQGRLMQPTLAAVRPSILESNAVRFLTNPQQFLEQALREQNGR